MSQWITSRIFMEQRASDFVYRYGFVNGCAKRLDNLERQILIYDELQVHGFAEAP